MNRIKARKNPVNLVNPVQLASHVHGGAGHCMERFDLCGGVDEVTRTISVLLEGATSDRLLDYLNRMDNQALTQRLGLILERLSTLQAIDESLIADIARLVGEHVYPLDPHGPGGGDLNTRWRIRENIDVLRGGV